MANKITAVEWLYSQITFNGLDDPDGQVLEQAKAMEKEQMKDTWDKAESEGMNYDCGVLDYDGNFIKYYNETYEQ